MNELDELDIIEFTARTLWVFHNGKVDKFLGEADDVEKGNLAGEIEVLVGFDLIGHPEFDELKKAFDKVEKEEKHLEEIKEKYKYSEAKSSDKMFSEYEIELNDAIEKLANILNKVAKSTLGKAK